MIGVIDKTNKEYLLDIKSLGNNLQRTTIVEAKMGYNWLDTKDVYDITMSHC